MESAENTEENVFIFMWKIKNFVHFEIIPSPIFFVPPMECGFALELFCSQHKHEESMIGAYLKLIHDYGKYTKLDFELSCLDGDGSVLIKSKRVKTRLKGGKRRGIWNFVPLHDVITHRRNEFLPQGTLTLRCKIWKSAGDMSESAVCFACTRVGIEKSTLVWRIEGFKELMKGGTFPHSIRKASQGDPPLSMNFHLEKTLSKGFQFELELTSPENVHKIPTDEDTDGKIGFYDLKMSFMNASGEEKLVQDVKRLEHKKSSKLEVFITNEMMSEENGYIVDDVLSLKCQFAFYEVIVSEEIEHTEFGSQKISDFLDLPAVVMHHHGMKTPLSSLKDIHKLLYDNRMFCDVKLRSGTECISAHKSILSARSPVFQSMFEDSKEDIVKVSDVDVETLRQMILFIYTDTVNDIELDIYQLFRAAKQYKISALKKKCSLMLTKKLNKCNVCKILRFADREADKDLKLAIRDFIIEHEKEVTSTPAWKYLKQRNAALANEICNLEKEERDF